MPLPAPDTTPASDPGRPRAPAFLITIDTEGDHVWDRPRQVTTENARFIGRFQALCERFDLRPTYLTNFEMAENAIFQEFGADVLRRGTAEIGMHMHAWDSPPIEPLGDQDWYDQPYAFEYPPAVVARKAEVMTRLLEDRFGIPVISHRAGRWGLNGDYARTLARLGYRVDCSVTPMITWQNHPGSPTGNGGPDFRSAPTHAYRLDLDDVNKAGDGPLLELPMTVMEGQRPLHRTLARLLMGRRGPKIIRLQPDGTNLADLLFIVDTAKRDARPYIQFTLHSSEFMPGGSSSFPTTDSIERLYGHMEALFEATRGHFVGRTLKDYADDALV